MTQAAGGLRFTPESLDEFGILREARVDDLDRDRTRRAEVGGAIHRAHAALPRQRLDAVFAVETDVWLTAPDFVQSGEPRDYVRRYLLNQSTVRPHASLADAASKRGVVSLLKPCCAPA